MKEEKDNKLAEEQLEEANGGRPPIKIQHYTDGGKSVHRTFGDKRIKRNH